MSNGDSIFEIREYLDGDGKVSSHDVTDISRELQHMEQLMSSMQENPTALNEEDQFIRELALLSEEQPLSDEALDADFLFDIESREKNVPTKAAVTKKVTGEKSKSGWGKGFLSNSKIAPKVAKASGTSQLIASTEQLTINETTASSPVPDTMFKSTEASPVPLKGILKSAEPADTPAATTEPMPNTAFSGSIMERAAPAKTVSKMGSNIILGGKKKPV